MKWRQFVERGVVGHNRSIRVITFTWMHRSNSAAFQRGGFGHRLQVLSLGGGCRLFLFFFALRKASA
jgi:hypothetical protein